ncbi:unnamed protein product [Pseudo-nitzschia multistriata]|uniref:SET domain-containing protein n=1 Tax=Pseudo-nitzschia multistriata TaxID=183589 RepID=A0A448ZSC1_9STRA|nr:unnamed protein product [Pseudo-nitzschia multistriata]
MRNGICKLPFLVTDERKWIHGVYGLYLLNFFLFLVVATGVVGESKTAKVNSDNDVGRPGESQSLSPWQQCSTFIAPTTRTNMNWGVIANRNFSVGEIVDISPLTVPIPDGSNVIERSVLNDYVYGYMRIIEQERRRPFLQKLYSVLLGPDMFYNHHPVQPNIEFTTFGREPSNGLPDAVNPQGFVAKRNILKGEELFTSYNGKDDGGKEWFRRRGVMMETPPLLPPVSSEYNDDMFDRHSEAFCSKIYSGLGLPSWKGRLLPLLPKEYKLPFEIDLKWLAPFDSGWGDAKTKVDVKKGERLEISTALVLSREFTKNTALMPLVYAWKDLHSNHQETLKRLHAAKQGNLHLQYQGPDTSWIPINNFTNKGDHNDFEDLVLFPAAGNIGMVRRRTGSFDANCRLVVHPSNSEDMEDDHALIEFLDQPVGVTIELIATTDIMKSTTLVVDLFESIATPLEYKLLFSELKLTGQPFSRQVFQDRRRIRKGREHTPANKATLLNEEL